MFKYSLTAKRIFLNTCLAISAALIFSTSVSVAAQNPDYASERQRAFGLLEAYVLFVKPDQGIARAYKTYRKANREKLERYWLDIVIGAK
jgi:hypothetical protein